LASCAAAESGGYRVEDDSLHPEGAEGAVGFASIEDMLIEGGLGKEDMTTPTLPRTG